MRQLQLRRSSLTWRGAALVALLPLCGCLGSDRITLIFDEGKTREEASRILVVAARTETQAGKPLTCASLLTGDRHPDDEDVLIAQETELEVPVPAGYSPLLVQVPQGRYAFHAEAFDRFGFLVARGCAVDEVTSRRPLDLQLNLETTLAPSGTLALDGPAAWLQPTGAVGLEQAPRASVIATDAAGDPLEGIELRVLVVSGGAVPLDDQLSTDAEGRGQVGLLVTEDTAQLLIHARGLQGSPIAFEVTGIASPVYRPEGVEIGAEVIPVALIANNFDVEAFAATDLLILFDDAGAGAFHLWRSGPGGGLGYEYARRFDTVAAPRCATSGNFDTDDRPDLLVASHPLPPDDLPGMVIHHHHGEVGDKLDDPEDEPLPSDEGLVVETLHAANVNQDAVSDLIVKVTAGGEEYVLVYLGLHKTRDDDPPFFELAQRFAIPGFVGNPEVIVGDMDSDGDDDIFLQAPLLGIWIVPCGDAAGAGSGVYHVPADITSGDWPYLFANLGSNYVVVADVDEDSFNDVIVVNDGSVLGSQAALRIGYGDGGLVGLELDIPRLLPLERLHHVLVDDFNADGHVDVVAVTNNPPQRAVILGGDGRGGFASPLELSTSMSVVDLASGDLNVDGINDLAFLGRTLEGSFLQVWMSEGLTR